MKIKDARVIVCSPGRNFVTLKVITDEGVYGLGDATLNGMEKDVSSYLENHCIPALIGKDPCNTEDLWHYFYRGSYWKRGAVTMTAVAAIDMALWDIKGKMLNTPLYNLIGGRSRDRIRVYCHSFGRDTEEVIENTGRKIEEGYKAIRIQSGIPGIAKAYGVPGDGGHYEPALKGVPPGFHGATDLSPVNLAASLHVDIAVNNFGIQEYMPHQEIVNEVFITNYHLDDGYLYIDDTSGIGVDVDEKKALKYPFSPASLSVNRKTDGTLFYW